MLPKSLLDEGRVKALPGRLLVLRDEAAREWAGIIHLPDRVVQSVRSHNATVIHSNASGLEEGDRVLIAAGVGRRIDFGEDRDIVSLYNCAASEIIGKWNNAEAVVALGDEDMRRHESELLDVRASIEEGKVDAGRETVKGHEGE